MTGCKLTRRRFLGHSAAGGGIDAIYVVANRNSGPYECKNVTIENNTTAGSGIRIAGEPAENNVVRGNHHVGGGGRIVNLAKARVENNEGYTVVESD